jgi:hypothetical protein
MPIEKSFGVNMALVNEHVHKGLSLEVARVAHRGEVPISIVKGLIEAEVDVLDLIVKVEPQEGIRDCHTIYVLQTALIKDREKLRDITVRSHIHWV